MNRTFLAASAFALLTASAVGLIACSSDTEESSDGSGEDDIKKGGAGLGATCDTTHKCKTGLLCKVKSSGPPPGTMGMPAPPTSSTSSGPPPGAMGMPAPKPHSCQNPDPGEEGGLCNDTIHCEDGLECIRSSSGSSTGGLPPGVMGMPIRPADGKCQKKSSGSSTGGPPPGALGLPIHP